MKFGLIGYPLGHSYSKSYFTTRFEAAGYDGYTYDNYELPSIEEVLPLLHSDLQGLNVTIPYKSAILTYLNEIDRTAFTLNAVNTVVRTGQFSWKGYNTDVKGFRDSLMTWFGSVALPDRALILGTGGGAKAVSYVLKEAGVSVAHVTRKGNAEFTYASLDADQVAAHKLIVNATPLGMAPQTDAAPEIPYQYVTPDHWLYDLVYNPSNTLFLRRGQQAGARTKNGLDMLRLQAEYAWAIWKMYGKL